MCSSTEIRTKLVFALGQLSSTVANFSINRKQVLDVCHRTSAEGAKFLILPGFFLGGCPAFDLWQRDEFLEEEEESLAFLQQNLPRDFVLILGSFWRYNPSNYRENPRHISVMALTSEGIEHAHHKTLLAKQGLFFEERYFSACADEVQPYLCHGLKIGILTYDECLFTQGNNTPLTLLKNQGLDLLIVVDNSVYEQGIEATRASILQNATMGIFPVLYVNAVGAQQGLVFDGGSRLIRPDGQVVKCPFFQEDVRYVRPFSQEEVEQKPMPSELEILHQALIRGVKDFVNNSGFLKVHLGLSGGIDSALVTSIAVSALGKENVTGILLPSCYSSLGSVEDAKLLAENLGIASLVIEIEEMHALAQQVLGKVFPVSGLTDENLQARLRGLFLMAYSNAHNSLLLTTGNKSELAVGYSTLYGDTCGVLSVIGDIWKTQVYQLCQHINELAGQDIIPEEILKKAPSAELRPDQKDQDSLPDYPVLDSVLSRYVEQGYSAKDLIRAGYDEGMVDRLLTMFHRSQYKRNQYAPIIHTTACTFSLGCLWPMVKK